MDNNLTDIGKHNISRHRKSSNESVSFSEVTLEMMITIVDRKKAEYYTDLIQSFDVNMQFVALGEGTADRKMLDYLGISDSEKAVIFSVVRTDKVNEIFKSLDNKFKTIKNGKGIAYTVPMSSLIGASVFGFLSDSRKALI